jgi:hypothetical protein
MMQPKITTQTKSKNNVQHNYRRHEVLEAPRGAAEPLQAQSIRKRRFCSLQRVKTRAPQRMMQLKITTQTKSKNNVQHNYRRESVVGAPRAAEPLQAQSIRSRRFRSLQRVKTRTPQRMMQPKITTQAKSKNNVQHNYR